MTAAYHLTDDWTHWIMAAFVVVTAAAGLLVLFFSVKREVPPYEPPSQSHVEIVDVPVDWEQESWA